jgi:hypothetical protein
MDSVLSQQIEHSNALIWAHARIYRSKRELQADKTAYVYRVACRDWRGAPICDIKRSFHLHRLPDYDPSERAAEPINVHKLWGREQLHDYKVIIGLVPWIGAYGAFWLVWEALSDRSLRAELENLRSDIQLHQNKLSEVNADHETLSLAQEDVEWLDEKIYTLKAIERSAYCSAALFTLWNGWGAIAILDPPVLRPIPGWLWGGSTVTLLALSFASPLWRPRSYFNAMCDFFE